MDVPIFRDFDAELAEVRGDPIQYKLGGVIFRCINPVPVGLTIVMTRKMLGADVMNPQTSADMQIAAQSQNLLWQFTDPSQHDELDTAVGNLQDPSIIQKVIEYIVTQATGRPTLGS